MNSILDNIPALQGDKGLNPLLLLIIMRYIYLILISFLLVGCYGTKKAEKHLDKAHRLQPLVAANKFQSWYPISSDSHEVVKWRLQVDTLFQELIRDSVMIDTFTNEKVRVIYKKINIIKEKIINAPTIYKIDSAKIYILEDKVRKAEKRSEKYFKKYKIFLYSTIAFVILFLLLWIYYLIKKK